VSLQGICTPGVLEGVPHYEALSAAEPKPTYSPTGLVLPTPSMTLGVPTKADRLSRTPPPDGSDSSPCPSGKAGHTLRSPSQAPLPDLVATSQDRPLPFSSQQVYRGPVSIADVLSTLLTSQN
jgi:hypothetical protein